ncbi:MAG: hypothetical protein LBI48_09580 [Burkholderiaceae bacterium]|nr:hypothetical protein [Burkholderiaceae bacterium]
MIRYTELKRWQHGELVSTGELGLEITDLQELDNEISQGDMVEVRADNGSLRHEMIGRILYKKEDRMLCAIDRKGFERPNYSEIEHREGRSRDEALFFLS